MSNTKECTLTDSELTEKVKKWVTDLCRSGGDEWCLRVPADHNHDPDFLFMEAVRRMNRYASRISELEAENKRLREALIEAKEDAAALIEQHRWIPVTERLPEPNVLVFGLYRYGAGNTQYTLTQWDPRTEGFDHFHTDFITHWQPLPQPPKEQ